MAVDGNKPAIVVLTGATGVGKTRVAIELCRRLNGEIVGADSVQVYRGFDIGSGKPTGDELAGVTHHLIDVLDPGESVDAARFAALADAAIASARSNGAAPIVVGGTGLWLRALLRGLVALPAVDHELRAGLEREFERLGGAALHHRLAQVDPITAAQVHERDQLRIVRALEVHAQTGQALGALRREHALGTPRYHALMIALEMPKPEWLAAITARVRGMMQAGLVPEVEALIARHGPGLRALRSVGYRQVAEGLARGLSSSEIEREVLRATRLYGKRQRTWLRSDASVDLWMQSASALSRENVARIEAHLDRRR